MSTLLSIAKKVSSVIIALLVLALIFFVVERASVAFLYIQGPSEAAVHEEASNFFRDDPFTLAYVDKDKNSTVRYHFVAKSKRGIILGRRVVVCEFQWFAVFSAGDKDGGMRIPFMPPILFDVRPAGWYYDSIEPTLSSIDRFMDDIRRAPNASGSYEAYILLR